MVDRLHRSIVMCTKKSALIKSTRLSNAHCSVGTLGRLSPTRQRESRHRIHQDNFWVGLSRGDIIPIDKPGTEMRIGLDTYVTVWRQVRLVNDLEVDCFDSRRAEIQKPIVLLCWDPDSYLRSLLAQGFGNLEVWQHAKDQERGRRCEHVYRRSAVKRQPAALRWLVYISPEYRRGFLSLAPSQVRR